MSAPGEGNNLRVVFAALAGNLLIAISKFVAAFFSGSIATLAEAVHSVADTANQVLLVVGIRRAEKPATNLHPFGHAVESYFWPFMVSILIFLLGGAFALYEGVHDLIGLFSGQAEHEHGSRLWSYGVLGVSFLFESYSYSVAYGEFKKSKGELSFREALMRSKDPTIPVVLAEDTAALFGLGIALVSVGLSDLTGWEGFDAIGSTLIGVVLGLVAYFLASRTHSLLLGEAASPEDRKTVEAIAPTVKGVVKVTQLLSMHLGPKNVILALKVAFDRDLDVAEIEKIIDTLETRIREELPQMRYIFVEPDGDYTAQLDPARPIETPSTTGR
ncbi:MAG: cation diffusion facilitator family transporter [Sandaracinaceae bacterium]|nr:cation diffusion facilitator family transporter [Sandaracinaceae bacterium]